MGSGLGKHSRINFYALLTVHLSIILDNDQLDTHLLYSVTNGCILGSLAPWAVNHLLLC